MTFKPIDRTGVSRRSLLLLGLSIMVGLIHHTDHVLRGDHSGWPFTAQITPFTYSLGVYILLVSAYVLRTRPVVSAICVTLVLGLTQFSHIVFELPRDQYQTWANGTNLVQLHAPVLGVLAAALSIFLSLLLATTILSFMNDARRNDRTLLS